MKNRATERLSLDITDSPENPRTLPIALDRVRQVLSGVANRHKSSSREFDAIEQLPGKKPPLTRISFALLVIAPFLSALFYYWHVASDQFVSEARFAVRSIADNESSTDGASLSMGAAYQDAFVVTSFIHSSEILRRLATKIDYRGLFAKPNADSLSSFPLTGSNEDFLSYWKGRVTAYIDGPSGIITLKVRTFDPSDSENLARLIIAESEELINELNQRAQRDLLTGIKAEVERSGNRYADSLAELNRFQRASGLLSPNVQAQETGKLLTGLVAQKLELETRIFVLKQAGSETSPASQQLSRAKESIDLQIAKLQSSLTGEDDLSLSKTIVDFSKVETNRVIAEKLYESARKTYDLALGASMRKALYLTVFVNPSLADESIYPERISTPFFIGLAFLIMWATLMLIVASVRDHSL
ncbi:capsule biosynthesis protein [Agrobacterium rosae]